MPSLPLLYQGGSPTWELPELTQINRLPMRTTFWPLDAPQAGSLPENLEESRWVLSLDGEWDFQYFPNPAAIPSDILEQPDGAWKPIAVPGCWQMQGYGKPAYTNIRMPFPNTPPVVPEANPTGVYQRRLEVPADWRDRRIVIQFGSADSVLYLYVNGIAVGMSKDSRLPAEFDLTELLMPGETARITAVVVQWSDATYVEDQDQWWLSGLPRSIRLYSTPKTYLADVRCDGDFDPASGGGTLEVQTDVRPIPGDPDRAVTLHLQIFDPEGREMAKKSHALTPRLKPNEGLHYTWIWRESWADVCPWNAEAPARYLALITLDLPEQAAAQTTAVRFGSDGWRYTTARSGSTVNGS